MHNTSQRVDVQNLISIARPGPIPHKAEDKNIALGSELYLELTVLCDQTSQLPKVPWLSEGAEGFISRPPSVVNGQKLCQGRFGRVPQGLGIFFPSSF